MRKTLAGVACILVICTVIFLIFGRTRADTIPTTSVGGEDQNPTGFPDGEVQMPFLFHDGILYYYNGRHLTDKADPNWKSAGKVISEDNSRLPQKEGVASRIAAGTQLFQKSDENIVWYKWSEHYYGLVPYTETPNN